MTKLFDILSGATTIVVARSSLSTQPNRQCYARRLNLSRFDEADRTQEANPGKHACYCNWFSYGRTHIKFDSGFLRLYSILEKNMTAILFPRHFASSAFSPLK